MVDPSNAGAEYWLAGSPSNDSRLPSYVARKSRYDLVLSTLSHFDEQCAKHPSSQDVEDIRNHAYDNAFCSDDGVFHSHLYNWMIEHKMTDALLEVGAYDAGNDQTRHILFSKIRPPFLEAHLQREPVTVENYQLLWQLHVKNGQFFNAAEILASLARLPE